MMFKSDKKNRLTPLQQRFVYEYLIDGKANEAARRAGYKAWRQGNYLTRRPLIAAAIQAQLDKQQKRTRITADRVLEELACIAFSDVRECFDANGQLKNVVNLDDNAAAALAGFESVITYKKDADGNIDPEMIKKIKLWNKVEALEKLGKHFNLFTEKVEVSGELTVKWKG